MSLSRRRLIGGLIAVALCISLLNVCDDRGQQQAAQQAQERRQAQAQAQLEAEQAKRLESEQAARDAEASRNSWTHRGGRGACAACIVLLLIGIHIGSRALARYRKDHPHG